MTILGTFEDGEYRPESGTADCADAVDIPYRSLSGKVGLDYVTGGSGGDAFALAGADAYRVRVTRRRVDEGTWGDRWLFRFWSAQPAPPRWWKRRETAVRPAEAGWDNRFSFQFTDLLRAVDGAREESGDATIESLRQFGIRWNRGTGWLDGSVSFRVPVLMHPSDVARQLGMPEPGRLADVLDVRATLEWAERQNLLHVTGSLDATFTMTV